ncbi:glycosyl transferase family 2 [Desulfatibacillum aliphaticivorans]|uniref:Glycosyl transferase family 2 n=1 Tax=Desulfatibacillum aliphaticivorans TaxID=218208 RepID=B8FE07_DESAL|nr:glycosyltransferase family 2 protein [Desulfatibacillum aliphaticivorans]ACL06788.1 glycosyl transferase family 2 [Desulfatibacillum aliphaticivorans]
MQKIKLLSIVSPAFNEGAALARLIPEMESVIPVLEKRCGKVEWIVADDGSTDNTANILKSAPDFVRRLPLEHKGMSAALYVGVMAARGEVVAAMDADCQNDPADLPAMLSLLESTGADMICGIRNHRKDTLLKRLSSQVSNRVRRAVLKDSIQDAGCTLRVFRADVRRLCFWPIHGGHRFVGPFAQLQGLHVVQVNVHHRARVGGRSRFGILDRAPAVVMDLAGAKWLMSRTLTPEESGEGGKGKGAHE